MTPQPGRRPSTTRAQISATAINLFTTVGFEETSVDDIAEAAGIARRTLFRYFPSKNEIPWGDFDAHLADLRSLLSTIPDDLPMADALTHALVVFNEVPEMERENHRRRMGLLLGVPSLQAHSMIVYADWRQVIASFCAQRLGLEPHDHVPQTIGWLCLGTALAAYEKWLADPHANLDQLLRVGCGVLSAGIESLH